jgi:hypothetical protein
MEKPVALIVSCSKDRFNGRANASRKTWLAAWGDLMPHQFILGDCNYETFADELVVAANDTYYYHPFKQRLAYAWALRNGFDGAFVGYTDTYLNVPEFLASNHDADYIGKCVEHGPLYASGGCGYYLSKRAMTELLNYVCHPGYGDELDGAQLAASGIRLTNNNAYGSTLSAHLGKATDQFDPEDMYRHHMEKLDAQYEGRNRLLAAASDPLEQFPVQDTGC